MIITILNGDIGGEETAFSKSLATLGQKLQDNHKVHMFQLAEMNLKYCTGCWSCWWKTPGKCAIKDDAELIFKQVIHSYFVIFASPLQVGFTSSLLKKITDRMIVLLHPYIELRQNESHHKKRYEKYPDIGLIVEKEPDTDNEDLAIIREVYERLALNFHCELKYVRFIDHLSEKASKHEISPV